MERKPLKVGDIIASRYTYGDECLFYEYFRVTKVYGDCEKVRLQKLAKYTKYLTPPPYYYNSPHVSWPVLSTDADEKPILRKVHFDSYGIPTVRTSDYYQSYSVWTGEALEEYNLH